MIATQCAAFFCEMREVCNTDHVAGRATGRASDCVSGPERSHWMPILLLFFAGCTVAFHIGKVPAALPELQDYWQLSLTQTSLIVSVYAVLIAILGLALGVLVRRIGYVKFAIVGIGLVGIASIAGSLATDIVGLLVCRAVEGVGWIIAGISMPPLLSALSLPRDQPLVMGIWGAFVPLGAGSMLLLAPTLQAMGHWQLNWQVCGGLSLCAAYIVFVITKRYATAFEHLQGSRAVTDLSDIRDRLIWVISACFFIYSLQFTSVTSFLPTLIIDTSSWSLAHISYVVALIFMSNTIGNLMAGVQMRKGRDPALLLLIGALGMGLCALLVFNASLPMLVRICSAFGFSILGGLIPGTCFALLPQAAKSAAGLGLLIGLMLQFAGFGQLTGPVMLAATVEYFGNWQAAGILALLISLPAALLSFKLRRYRL